MSSIQPVATIEDRYFFTDPVDFELLRIFFIPYQDTKNRYWYEKQAQMLSRTAPAGALDSSGTIHWPTHPTREFYVWYYDYVRSIAKNYQREFGLSPESTKQAGAFEVRDAISASGDHLSQQERQELANNTAHEIASRVGATFTTDLKAQRRSSLDPKQEDGVKKLTEHLTQVGSRVVLQQPEATPTEIFNIVSEETTLFINNNPQIYTQNERQLAQRILLEKKQQLTQQITDVSTRYTKDARQERATHALAFAHESTIPPEVAIPYYEAIQRKLPPNIPVKEVEKIILHTITQEAIMHFGRTQELSAITQPKNEAVIADLATTYLTSIAQPWAKPLVSTTLATIKDPKTKIALAQQSIQDAGYFLLTNTDKLNVWLGQGVVTSPLFEQFLQSAKQSAGSMGRSGRSAQTALTGMASLVFSDQSKHLIFLNPREQLRPFFDAIQTHELLKLHNARLGSVARINVAFKQTPPPTPPVVIGRFQHPGTSGIQTMHMDPIAFQVMLARIHESNPPTLHRFFEEIRIHFISIAVESFHPVYTPVDGSMKGPSFVVAYTISLGKSAASTGLRSVALKALTGISAALFGATPPGWVAAVLSIVSAKNGFLPTISNRISRTLGSLFSFGTVGAFSDFLRSLTNQQATPTKIWQQSWFILIIVVVIGILGISSFPIIGIIGPFQALTQHKLVWSHESTTLARGGIATNDHGTTDGVSGPCGLPYSGPRPPDSSIPSSCPVSGGTISQCPNGSYSHSGVQAYDFALPNGSPVQATQTGFVSFFHDGDDNGTPGIGGCSNQVQLVSYASGQIITTVYGHLSNGLSPEISAAAIAFENCVKDTSNLGCKTGAATACDCPGAIISAGTTIGYVDDTGNSTGPHLHYEYRGPGGIQIPIGCAGFTGSCN